MAKMSNTTIDKAEKAIRALKELLMAKISDTLTLEIHRMIQRIKKEIKKQ